MSDTGTSILHQPEGRSRANAQALSQNRNHLLIELVAVTFSSAPL